MMGIVVDQQKTIARVLDFEPPPGVAKLLQRPGDFLEWNSELGRKRDDTNGILHIVPAGNIQARFAQFLALAKNRKDRGEIFQQNILSAIIRLISKAVGN